VLTFLSSTTSTIAVFDFDNTITDRDSLLPFLFYVQGVWKTIYFLILLVPDFLRYMIGNISRQAIKEKILIRFIGGKSFTEVQAFGKQYAEGLLDRYLKPEALKRLAWHQAQGDRCLLVSASLEFYLSPWAMRYGFEAVIASHLEVTSNGLVTGCLEGLNCWGSEKERRLLAYLGAVKPHQLYVYGDSRGDQEMLALAHYPFYRKFE
jgi:HAD superfamily hydrolase (TIGR01490 family)